MRTSTFIAVLASAAYTSALALPVAAPQDGGLACTLGNLLGMSSAECNNVGSGNSAGNDNEAGNDNGQASADGLGNGNGNGNSASADGNSAGNGSGSGNTVGDIGSPDTGDIGSGNTGNSGDIGSGNTGNSGTIGLINGGVSPTIDPVINLNSFEDLAKVLSEAGKILHQAAEDATPVPVEIIDALGELLETAGQAVPSPGESCS